jgi:hypothetical protein
LHAKNVRPLRLALISDVHLDVMHDGPERLERFIRRAKAWKADGVLEMGDFCTPRPECRTVANIFESFPGPRFHVLGNHDMDNGFSREHVVAFHGMPGRYYSFDLGGLHGVVLDANDRHPDHAAGYPSFIADDQISWLEDDLAKTNLPVIVFSHQSLERPSCIRSQGKVRSVLESAKRPDGSRKVAACFNGHWHIDHSRVINGIPYIHVNSASYYWVGSEFKRLRYSPEIHQAHPALASTAPYRESLFTLLEIDARRGRFTLTGARTTWVGPSPQELGLVRETVDPAWITPVISKRASTFKSPR